jgi:putative membrane protein
MMFWDGQGMNGWGWAAMTISTVLFWGLIVLAGVLLLRAQGRPPSDVGPAERPSPEDVLAHRFARGEIDEEEYRSRLGTLSSGPAPVR